MPNPFLLEVAVEPKSAADAKKLAFALTRLTAEDPSFGVAVDPKSGATILKGCSELHLDDKIGILIHDDHVAFDIVSVRAAYREKLSRKVDVDYTHKKQTDGASQFARAKMSFEPNEIGAGNVLVSRVPEGALPEVFVQAVAEGFQSAAKSGVVAGFPVVDLKAVLIDGAFRDGNSSVLAFESAARAATREALRKGGCVLLEPIVKVEVVTPEDFAGSVIGDLTSRRGQILDRDMRGDTVVIEATAPFANLLGYANALRSFTQGRAQHSMEFSHYAPVPLSDDDGPFAPAAAMRA